MFEYKLFNVAKIIVCGAVCATLAACGSPTYGTGKTQEELLIESLTSIPRVGISFNKEDIRYINRPTLISPPESDELPNPLEPQQQKAEDEFFPTNPEKERKELNAAIKKAEETGQPLADNIQEIKQEDIRLAEIQSEKLEKENIGTGTIIQDDEKTESALQRFFGTFRDDDEDIEGLPVRIDPTNEDDIAAIQAPERRWLTEPPRKYRTPEGEAPIGDVGEPEIDIEKAKEDRAKAEERKKKGGLFGLFKKDKDEDENADADEEDEDASAEDEDENAEDTSADDSTDDETSENSDS